MNYQCIWFSKKRERCPWKQVNNTLFCKRHNVYNGIYTQEDIDSGRLIFCSGCNNLFDPIIVGKKQCDKCNSRRKISNDNVAIDDERSICRGIKKNGPCTYACKNGKLYCAKHESYGRWKDLTSEGKNVCKNWVRGCFCIINDEYKTCKECRQKEQNADNARVQKRRNTANKFNIENENVKMCIICNATFTQNNTASYKCYTCYEKHIKSESERGVRDELGRKLSYIKKSAKSRKINWELSDDFARHLMQSKCVYCDQLVAFNGIDRVDSGGIYIDSNCVACCKICNIMKQSFSAETFLNIVKYILSVNFLIDIPTVSEYKELFDRSNHATYGRFLTERSRIDRPNKTSEISESMYNFIITQPCNYCKNAFISANIIGARGIDRIDSSIGYIIGNIVPACKTCNFMKNVLSVSDFFKHLTIIYNYRFLHIEQSGDCIQNKIIKLCKESNIKMPKISHEVFIHRHDFYNDIIFKYTNFDQIRKIKIKLVIVNSDRPELMDIWNYYRRHVSSFQKINYGKLNGRQIYILVQDETTQKYLGILSLSSDYLSLECRDKYIGWDFDNKKRKINNILNISTCVPLQPFGYNFNGGKLMASIAFSKEIIDYYRDAYSTTLLGITTTSLYGKSIQYDRLPFLKYMGNTKGNSVSNIPPEVTKLCANYLNSEYNINYPLRKKFIILQKAFDKLGMSKENLLKSNPKGVYFGFTCADSKSYLDGTNDCVPNLNSPKYNVRCVDDIFEKWCSRWADQRITHLQKEGRVQN